ncbi:MAG: Lon protease-like protein [Maribacter sp.]|jgi:Lon protease-like protein
MAFLPMFPLNLVVFPDENLNLHIFEPKYRELVDDCLLFGIPMIEGEQVLEIGTEVHLYELSQKYPSGESDIKTKGIRRFKVLNFYKKAPDKLYSAADIEYLEDIQDGNYLDAEAIIGLIDELFVLMKIEKLFEHDANLFQTFSMGHHVGFSSEQEYELLTLDKESQRQGFMRYHLEQLIPTLKEMKRLEERVKMNGHFKDLNNLQ